VPAENVRTCSGAVNHFTKSMAARFFWSPLSNTTQLSGPEMVWWLPPEPAKVGKTCTPYLMSDSWLRSHGPVTSMATLPLFISFGPFSLVVSRYSDLSSTAICCSTVSARTPAGESNAACSSSGVRMLPPASQSMGR
jgi:hypothetical protein